MASAWKENNRSPNRRKCKKLLGKSFPFGTALLEQTLLCITYVLHMLHIYNICQPLKISLCMKIFAVHMNINFCQSPCVAFKPKYCTHCILTIWSRLQQVYFYIREYKHDPYKKGGSVPLPWVWGSWWAFYGASKCSHHLGQHRWVLICCLRSLISIRLPLSNHLQVVSYHMLFLACISHF